MSAKNKTKINLLPQKGFSNTVAGRILLWILTTFRILVIVTEIVVMIAFLSRFWLDAKNTDLNEKLNLKKALLETSLPFEENFKATQTKLAIASELITNQYDREVILTKITESLTGNILVEKIEIGKAGVGIEGISPEEKSIQQLIANLGSKPGFEEVKLSNVEEEGENNILSFKINIKI